MSAYFLLKASCCCTIKHVLHRNIFWLESGEPKGAAMLIGSLPMKNRKGLARDVFDTFATHAGRIYDVTDSLLSKKMAALSFVFSRLFSVDFS